MRKTLYWIFPLFLLLLCALFPMILSSPLGKPILISLMEKKLKAEISIENLQLSWLGPQKFQEISFKNKDLKAEIETLDSNVAFWDLADIGSSFTLKNGNFTFPSYGNGSLEKVDLTLHESNLSASGSTPQGGILSLQGKVFSKEDFDVTANLKKVPTGLLDQLLKANGLLYKALGATLDFTATFLLNRSQGVLDFTLSSPNGQTSCKAELSEKAVTLKEPLTATLKMTEPLSTALLGERSQIGLISQTPLFLQLNPKGFFLPYRPFSLSKLQIASGTIDLGQMILEKGDSLNALFRFLKSPGGSGTNMWFAPTLFRLQEGVLELSRLDFLLGNRLHLCLWGFVNLLNKKLDLFLGIPSETLASAFGLQNLPRNYVLKIPLRGTLDSPELDTASAAAKIAALSAANAALNQGGVFKGFLQLFSRAQDDEDVPPANRPFPWER